MKNLPKIQIGQKPTYKKIADNIDFFALFQKMEPEFSTCFLFESLGEEAKFSRYSIIGFDPEVIISARGNALKINNTKYHVKNPYESLRKIMPEKTITREYAGGLVGYLSYDAVNYFEPSIHSKVHKDFDQFMFGVYTDGLIYDKITDEVFYFYYQKDRSTIIHTMLKKKIVPQNFSAKFIKNGMSKGEHAAIVARVKEHILSGKTFQCEVGFKTEYEVNGDTLQIYKRLRSINPSPFMYFVKFTDKKIIGASPELLFSLREGEMTSNPLAGTTKRGKDAQEDQQLVRELLNDSKERA